MNRIRSIRAALATLACTLLALAAAPAAFASPLPRAGPKARSASSPPVACPAGRSP
jgi:hypothetical protein